MDKAPTSSTMAFNHSLNGAFLAFFSNVWKGRQGENQGEGKHFLGKHMNDLLHDFIGLSVLIDNFAIVHGPAATLHLYQLQDEEANAGKYARIRNGVLHPSPGDVRVSGVHVIVLTSGGNVRSLISYYGFSPGIPNFSQYTFGIDDG